MIVVADTSPLNYLVQAGCDWLLNAIFGKIIVPAAVIDELSQQSAPESVRRFAANPPEWLQIQSVASIPRDLANFGSGEAEAIALADNLRAELLLIDDRLAAKMARKHGMKVTGTLGVLIQAANMDLIEIEPALAKLAGTTFRCTPDLLRVARAAAES